MLQLRNIKQNLITPPKDNVCPNLYLKVMLSPKIDQIGHIKLEITMLFRFISNAALQLRDLDINQEIQRKP